MGAVTTRGVRVHEHPLDPLSAEEIAAAVEILRAERDLSPSVRFVEVALREPPKEAVLGLQGTARVEREAAVILLDPAEDATYEAVVSLTAGAVVSWKHVPGAQPPFMLDEYADFERTVKAHPEYQEALRRRGITDLDLVSIDPVPAGYWSRPEDDGRRLCRAISFLRARPGGNSHARHIEGVVGLFDLNAMEVVSIEDNGAVPVPPDPGEYARDLVGPLRTDVRALEIGQPEGPSFEVDGYEVRWQKWRFRIGFTPREGLVLHTVTYQDGDRERQVLYRASYSEVAVSYADPGPNHWFMSFFDIGDLQVGTCANALEVGCDCLGLIRYFDAVVSNTRGEPVVLPNAICLHEEDFGLLWKHVDLHTGKPEVRRSRRLVVSWITTLGNYEYGFYWYLYQDGSIESEVKLTGIVQTGAVAPGETPTSGELVAPQVNGIHHQHIFNVRLDLDIDGQANSVHEVHSEAIPTGPENPYGTAFVQKASLLATESEAQRVIDPLVGRYWKVVNESVRNGLGQPVGYKLVPGENVPPLRAGLALRKARRLHEKASVGDAL